MRTPKISYMKKEVESKHYHHGLRNIAFFGVVIFVILVFLFTHKTPSKEAKIEGPLPTVIQAEKAQEIPEQEVQQKTEQPTETEQIHEKDIGEKKGEVPKIETKNFSQAPPVPFDLTS